MQIRVHLSWGFEAQPDTLVVTGDLLLGFFATVCRQNTLLVLENGGLLLVGPLGLRTQRHTEGSKVEFGRRGVNTACLSEARPRGRGLMNRR